MKKHNSYKKRLKFECILLFLYIIAVIIALVPTAVSKLTSSGEGESTAQIAKFGVEYKITSKSTTAKSLSEIISYYNLEDIYPGWKDEFTVTIENTSDITVMYNIDIECMSNIPLNITFDNTNDEAEGLLKQGEQCLIVIKLEWSPEKNDIHYVGEIEKIRIVLHYDQID